MVPPGHAVTLGIRPERMHFGEDGGPHSNTVRGRIRQAVYTGTVTRYTVEVGAAELVVAALGPRRLAAGEETGVWWAIGDTILIGGDRRAGDADG